MTAAKVPAWLDVDKFVDPEFRSRVLELSERVAEARRQLAPLHDDLVAMFVEIEGRSEPVGNEWSAWLESVGACWDPNSEGLVEFGWQLHSTLSGAWQLRRSVDALGHMFDSEHIDKEAVATGREGSA